MNMFGIIPIRNGFQRSRGRLLLKGERHDLEGAGLESLKQQYQNDVELEYHVDQLKAAVLTEAKWNSDKDEVSKPKSFKRHMSKNTKPHPSFYNNDFYYLVCLSTEEKYTTSINKHYAARYYKQGIEDMISDRWSKETHRYIFEALNGIHHWEDSRIDFFKAEMSTRTKGSIYSDLRIKLVVRVEVKKKWGYGFLSSIVVRRSDDKEYEFSSANLPRLSLNDVEDMYLLQVQDKIHHLPLEFVKDFNNALLLFIRRVVIQNRVEDIQLGVESYQQTLNLTKHMIFFEGIDQKIPFTMSGTHKGVVYLNQHNIKSFMKLSEVKKFCDGTLIKIRENLVDMVKKNKLGTATPVGARSTTSTKLQASHKFHKLRKASKFSLTIGLKRLDSGFSYNEKEKKAFAQACQAAYEASKPKIQRTPVEMDRYGAHNRLVAAYFSEHPQYEEATFRRVGISSLMKCTSAIRQIAYGAVPDALDEYMQIGRLIVVKSDLYVAGEKKLL
ncbi:hypothetical protein Tco_1507726 [Tanacetum coccineum]